MTLLYFGPRGQETTGPRNAPARVRDLSPGIGLRQEPPLYLRGGKAAGLGIEGIAEQEPKALPV